MDTSLLVVLTSTVSTDGTSSTALKTAIENIEWFFTVMATVWIAVVVLAVLINLAVYFRGRQSTKTLLTLTTLLLGGLLADASTYSTAYAVGYTDGAYTYAADGYWWKGTNAYNRVTSYYSTFYANGVCYPAGYYYSYQFSHIRPQLTSADPQWRTKLLDIYHDNVKTENDVRKGAFEQAYFNDTVKTLGLQGKVRYDNGPTPLYGAGSVGGYGASLQLSTAGANGSTLYGYSYNQQASIYGEDLGAYMTMADRQINNISKIFADQNNAFIDRINQAGEEQNKVALVIAKGKVVQEFLRGLDDRSAKITTQLNGWKASVDKDGKTTVTPTDPTATANVGDTRAEFEKLATDRCVSCHGKGGKWQDKFDVTNYPAMTPSQKLHVLQRIDTDDATKVMPRDATDHLKPGVKLTNREKQLFMLN